MIEFLTLLTAKDLTWFLGPIALGLVAVVLLWVYRSKRNGNGSAQTIQNELKLDDRMTMLEADFREFKTLVQTEISYLTKDVDEVQTTSGRFSRELGVIADRLDRITKTLG